MTRKETLISAINCVCVDREQAYSSPENNFTTIARFWNTYLSARKRAEAADFEVTPKDIAAMMSLLKIARIASGNAKEDSWIDLAGYAACGCELETEATDA